MNHKRPRVFTWHIHGSYLYYLSQCDIDIYIPVNEKKTEGYYGRGETFPFGNNVHEIAAEDVRHHKFDCIIFQTNQNYLTDQFEIFSKLQLTLPRIYIEHNTPLPHPTDTRHVVDDKDVTLVHVTHFNKLMWNNNNVPVKVIEHGVTDPGNIYKGDLDKGIVVINNLPDRGRLLGFDVFNEMREQVPIDLVGMGSLPIGLGEVLHPQLPEFISHYRFFFNPIRYTSLGLAICEAMMAGIPVVALATTELTTVIQNSVNGFIHTDTNYLADQMNRLIEDKNLAAEIGARGRETALQRFHIKRFKQEWEQLINSVVVTKNTKNLIYE